jgi:hypothetical protein
VRGVDFFTEMRGWLAALGTPSPVMSEEDLAYKEAAKAGGAVGNLSASSRRRRSSSRRVSTAKSQRVSKRELQLSRSRRSGGDRQMVVPKESKGMVLPFEPLSISFDEISYFVDMPAVSDPAGLL